MDQVAVVIAAHNAAGTVRRAIVSALREPHAAEVIVIDDASTDDTVNCARTADDGSKRLKIIIQSVNSGPSAARNRGIMESKSPWIAVLDADDFFLPGRLGKLLALAKTADFLADDLWQVTDTAEEPQKSLLDLPPCTLPRVVKFAEFVSSNVTERRRPRGEMGFLKPLMRRGFLDAHRLRYQEHMRLGEDYELYARALALGAKFLLVPVQGYVSFIRPDSLSGRHSEADLLALRECDHALGTLTGLSAGDKAVLRRHYLSIDCRLQWRRLINAVKTGDKKAALATFARPYPVPFYLLSQLADQLILRTSKKLKRNHK